MLRYIQGTKLLGITYTGYPSGTLDIQVYSNSDYIGDLEMRRSTTSYMIYMARSPTIWKSNRQKAVTLLSTEVEYYVLLSVAKEAAWIQHFLLEIGYNRPDIEPILVNRDNQGSFALAENP